MMKTLFGIDGRLGTEARNLSLRLASAWPLWVTLLVVGALGALVWWLYRREKVGLSSRAVGLFTFLRVAAWTLLLLMLFEPELVWDVPEEKSSSLMVILDDSQSMSIADRYDGSGELRHVVRAMWPEMKKYDGTEISDLTTTQQDELAGLKRVDVVNHVLSEKGTGLSEKLAKEFSLEVFTASENLQSAGGESEAGAKTIPKVEPRGAVTRLGDLVREAVGRSGGRVAAVVLVTDGEVNAGEDLESLGRYLGEKKVRVYGMGVGDPREPKDLRIRSAEANRVALLGDMVTVNVALESTGFRGETAQVRLKRDGQPVNLIQGGEEKSSAKVVLAEETMEVEGRKVAKPQKMELGFRADKAGTFTYTVEIEPRREEMVADNNRVDLPVRVVDEKMKVLYIEGLPRWEYRYLKNDLTRDEKIDVSCVLTSADFEFAQEGDLPISYFPSKEEDLFAYDVVIIGDVPRAELNEQQQAMIVKLVEKLGGGMVMIAGEKHAPEEYRGTVIEKMLPVDLDRRGLSAEETSGAYKNKLFKPVLTAEGEVHPETSFLGDVEANKRLWAELPGMFWHYPVARAKPGATVLLTHPEARSNYGPEPLLAVQYYGAGKCAFLGVDETWRWRDRVGDRYETRFWGQVIRDLCQNKLIGKSKRFRVSTSKNEYRLGEKVEVFAQVLDERFEPETKVSVEVELEGPGSERAKMKLGAEANEAGRFHGEFMPQSAGPYRVRLVTTETALPEEAVTHSFLVRPSLLEFQDVSMNEAGLKKLSELTGGRYFHVDEAGELGKALVDLKASSMREMKGELWNSPLLFVVFAGLFITELLYRKRRKLL